MTKEEIIKNIILRRGALHVINEHRFYSEASVINCLQEAFGLLPQPYYADQETERLKAELNEVKKQYSELCDVQKKLCEQNISLESELNELKKLESAKGRLSLLMLKQKAEKELNELKEKYENAIKTVKALSNENDGLKEKHKRDVIEAYEIAYNHVGDVMVGFKKITGEQYYKQKFESND